MSERYPGGIITKTPVTPTGPYQNGTAPGVWTLDQQLQFQQQGIWPTAGSVDPSAFIENLFSTYLYTGNASTQAINNGIDLSTKGGLVWAKSRSNVASNALFDTVRGGSSLLVSNTTAAAYTGSTYINPFSTNGFTWAIGDNQVNQSGRTYVSWTFRKQAKFFDVVTYTGTGSNTTIAHALGSVPGCIIVKRTDTTADWAVYHRSLANTQYLALNTASAAATGATWWNSTTPTSAVFSVGTDASVNASGGTYVAYLFAHDAGGFGLAGTDNVISCGSFTTGGSGNATVSLGYEPQWVLIKANASVANWWMFDTMRGWSQTSFNDLYANSATSEGSSSGNYVFPTATGFNTANNLFDSSIQHIYIAIRRGPMKTPTDATKVFIPVSQTGGGTVTTNFPVDLSISTIKVGSTNDRSVFDRLRGSSTNSYQTLYTNLTRAEEVGTGGGLGFDNNTGYVDAWNSSSYTDIYWNFRRAPGFFDEVCYTGTGANQTVAHNLGVVPELMIVKSRSAGSNWVVYSSSLGATDAVFLNLTDATSAFSNTWNNTTPTSSVFSIGTAGGVNQSGTTFVAYLFATVAGVSKVGSYTGNGTTQTINCGFGAGGARWLLVKRTDSTGNWYVFDSARGFTSSSSPYLLLNSTAAEVTGNNGCYSASTGFTVTSTASATVNINGASYIYVSVA